MILIPAHGISRWSMSTRAEPGCEPRFLADRMLGRLARWLRIMGFDAAYASDVHDSEIAARAEKESRVLLTRDRELSMRRNISAIYVESDILEEQLADVLAHFGLKAHAEPVRCTECNGILTAVSAAEASAVLCYEIASRFQLFYRCSACHKIYWRGSHWLRINDTVDRVNSLLASREHHPKSGRNGKVDEPGN